MTVDKELFADTLPTYLTRFVGRDREIAAVLSMLHPGRLVTVCGVGGAGKTRLAIEVAKRSRAQFRDDGARWRGVLGAARLPWSIRPKCRRLWLPELAFRVSSVIGQWLPSSER